ncbi:MAG: VWA domain-containing protein [Candidatus Lokiarchaeota archaeon]|nr:VWA domain-containing protein [Candidatus Lokiarchaeota archaeon]
MPILYDLFEKDFFSDLLALINIGKRISGKKDIYVEFNQNSQLTFTDGRFIYLPRKIQDDIRSAQGLVAHESGHIGYGSFELSFIKLIDVLSKKYDLPQYFVKQVINIVEDVRVNSLNYNKFPGFHENLRTFTLQLLPDLILNMKRTGDLLVYINLFMENYKGFETKPRFRTRIMSDQEWYAISTAKDFLLKSLTPASSIITIDQLCKVLKKFYTKKKVVRDRDSRDKTQNRYPPNSDYGNFEELTDCDDWNGDYSSDEFENYEENMNKTEYEKYLEELQDSEFMEDPYLYENGEEDAYYNSPMEFDPLINRFEEFVQKDKKAEPSELSYASEQVIEKIKNLDLNTTDIEDLIKEVEQGAKINTLEENIEDSLKPSESNLSSEISQPLDSNEELTESLNNNRESPKVFDFESFKAILDTENQDSIDSPKDNTIISEITKLLYDSQTALERRLILIENQEHFCESERKVKEVGIENEEMRPISLSYKEIVKSHKNIITKLKNLFRDLRNQTDVDTSQKRGRLNNKFIKAVTSDFKYDKCFTRKLNQKELKILLMVDISGSMAGIKLEAAKVAMVILCESLYDIAQLRIVLFTGEYDALNIQLKEFEEHPDIKKFDKFGRHQRIGSNLDGVSLKHEAAKLEKNVLILVISDGQPAGTQYGLTDAIKEIQDVKKRFKVYAFSIDAKGDYLNKLYGNNWVLTKSSDRIDLAEKLTQFCKLVVKEFFR